MGSSGSYHITEDNATNTYIELNHYNQEQVKKSGFAVAL